MKRLVREYRRGGSPAGLYTFRRLWCRLACPRPANGSARDYPAEPISAGGFPEFTRFASTRSGDVPHDTRRPRVGPLFAEGNRRSIQLSYGRS